LDTSPNGYLGRGAFSICRKCRRIQDNKMFAVKIVSSKFGNIVLREIRILEHLGYHPNIVKVVEALSDPMHYYIVLELLEGGELLKRVKKMQQFTESQASKIMAQIVSAVTHMHAKGIVHRDLKPENILFENEDPTSTLRLIDFGFARLLPNSVEQLSTPCFTLHYAAPEVLEIEDELPQYNQQCDLWSLGVILFTMLSGNVPFHAKNKTESASEIIARIRLADYQFGPEFDSVSETAKDLVKGLLTVDPKKRLSLIQLANHPWLTQRENTTRELQTPTILPSSADESFNETYSAFLTANRDGFQLMDVDTAPLLVKRRGLKRRLEDPTTKDGRKVSGLVLEASKLATVPEGSEPEGGNSQRPTSLKLQGQTPGSAAFTEFRDTRPPYLKYSRDVDAESDAQ
jgi:ribosomal protein S6 kinase alpha-5